MKKYRVTLEIEEREELQRLLSRGKGEVRLLKHAQILLKAAESAAAPGWEDQRIAEAVGVGVATVQRVRERFVQEGFAAALRLYRKGTRVYHTKLAGKQEAHWVALACSAPPEGRGRWTLRLWADPMVVLKYADELSYETVRQTLKKTNLSLT